ncbi:SDR family oxidoreductase [Pleomorphomonas oryzae]|uniref:SDR family oxidoreductase n=1 Tax=Pleomorphomonas oryzae TaxID=261934 RepID=UPI00041538D5|nr:SDR family oxidoreductase [Pleomorphomonas oryzae]
MSKTWFITGASSGLGLEMTRQLLARGDKVVGTARRLDALDSLKQQHADKLTVMALELTDIPGIRAIVDEAFRRMGRIDVVVQNAGYGLVGAGEEVSDVEIDRQIATNLVGSIQVIRAVLPHLRRQGGGRILQVTSEGGQVAYPNFSIYHASKWGVEGFIESVAQETAPFGIDFIIAEPGATETGFGANLVHAAPMAEYENTPAGEIRRAITGGSFVLKGDAKRTASAMIAAADQTAPPFRLALGSTAYSSISHALSRRLAVLEAQRTIAFSADRDR